MGDFTTSPPDPAVDDAVAKPVTSLASIDDEGEGCGDGEVDCEPPPNKKRRTDGGFKQSGLKEGMHRAPYTLLLKYHVATEFRRNQELKEKGLITNPLECTSQAYNGLAFSNVWKWHQQLEQLRVAITHETSGCRRLSNRKTSIVSFISKQARKLSLNPGRKATYFAAEAELLNMLKEARSKELKLTERWLKINMKRVIGTHYGSEAAERFRGSYGWLHRFCARNNLSLRRTTNKKHESLEIRLPKIKRWHARLRMRLKDAPGQSLIQFGGEQASR